MDGGSAEELRWGRVWAWLREVVRIVDSLAELKVLVYVLDAFVLRGGWEPVPLTLDQVQDGTGLCRQSTVEGMRRARQRGLLRRRSVRGRYEYEPEGLGGGESRLQCVHEHEHVHDDIQEHEDVHVTSESTFDKAQAYRVLTEEFGVAARVAEDLAARFDVGAVMRQVEYARFEVAQGRVRSTAGYIVARIRDCWGPPAGYGEQKSGRWYTDEEFEQFFEQIEVGHLGGGCGDVGAGGRIEEEADGGGGRNGGGV
jgi:hypothetical protein